MIHVSFRFDDISPISDHSLERQIFVAFARYEIPLTVAAIPCCEVNGVDTPIGIANVAHLAEAVDLGAVEVAQHGYSHKANWQTANRVPSEFRGLPAKEQRERIEHGRDILTRALGVPPLGFVPPWNTYDEITVTLLHELKYRYVSAGWEIPRTEALLPTLPRTCWLHNLRSAMREAGAFSWLRPHLLVVFHAYDFKESGDSEAVTSIADLYTLLAWARAQEGVKFSNLYQAAASPISPLSLRIRERRSLLPPRLRPLIPEFSWLRLPTERGPALARAIGSARKAAI